MQNILFALIALLSIGRFDAKSDRVNDVIFPFQNISLPWDERVDDLVIRLTVDEMVAQMAHGGDNEVSPAPAIPRLGIMPWVWRTECTEGIVSLVFRNINIFYVLHNTRLNLYRLTKIQQDFYKRLD